jgi:trehalose/maltose hydrolase-like predicted phosphorylase
MAAVFGFGGLHSSDRGLRLNPNLPPRWSGLRFNLVLHGERVAVAIDRRQVRFEAGAERSVDIPISVGGRAIMLKSGQTMTVPHGAEDDRTV